MIINSIQESIAVKQRLLEHPFPERIQTVGNTIISALKSGHTIFVAGNGGSAADAQHFVAELAGTYERKERKGLSAIALTTNTSNLTAIANDYGYQYIFSRQLEGLAEKGNVLVAISTSGNSENILQGLKTAKEMKLVTIGLTGGNGGKMKEWCDVIIAVPSMSTPRIQECHILIIHAICKMIDADFT